MRTRGFTLIELLVIIGIMATMVTVGIVNINASRSAMRLSGAGRGVIAMIRQARSMALITQKPVVVTYSTDKDDDDCYAKVEVVAEKIIKSDRARETVWNLNGDIVYQPEGEPDEGDAGDTLENVLTPKMIPMDVVKGLRIKVLDESDQLLLPENETRRSKISIFSTADSVARTLTTGASAAGETHGGTKDGTKEGETSEADEATDEPFSVAFAVNGTVNPPHRIWIYRDGSSPEDGICIHVDRFGEPKCEDFQ